MGNLFKKIDVFILTCIVILRNSINIKKIIDFNSGYIVIKVLNQHGVEEIIGFSTIFEEKKNDVITDNNNKKTNVNQANSFIEEDINKLKNKSSNTNITAVNPK